jgi:hypothetical protein
MKENQVLNSSLLKILQLKISRYLETHFSINHLSKDKLLNCLNQKSQKKQEEVEFMEMDYLEYSGIITKGMALNQLAVF